jgi:FixJ family two-component response regulator
MASVTVVDDDLDTRVLFEKLFEVLGVSQVLTYGSVEDMQAARERVLASSLAILDVNLGRGLATGLDAFAWLRANRYRGRIVFLTGHAKTHPLVLRAADMPGVEVLEKPVAFDQVAALWNEASA